MDQQDIKRISRLTAILTQLQTRRLTTATELASRFSVSTRTIYRDIRALEQAGVPVLTEDGKGYSLMEGYRVPPVMFTENEANALITAEQILLTNRDSSFTGDYTSAIGKIKAVLHQSAREKSELLAEKIAVSPAFSTDNSSNSLSLIQRALTSYRVLDIYYEAAGSQQTSRQVEPFALYYSLEEHWLMIAYCRLRNDYRMFRLNSISRIRMTDTTFEPHKLTLAQYLEEKRKNFTTPDTPLS